MRLLAPLASLHRAWRAWLTWAYRVGLMQSYRAGVPVIVIGNLYIGGTGKTPLAIELVRQLRARGWQPGIVSRGYGASKSDAATSMAREVDANGSAAEFGDEPLLLAQATGVPVVIGRDRVAAVKLLRNVHHRTDVIITDDGLQHRRLARDVELALVHYRGLGNGWMLPAGPLREPPQRLQSVDAVVFHDQLDTPRPLVRVHSPFYGMRTALGDVFGLKDASLKISLAQLAREQSARNLRIVAACGIGMPDRFFAMLRAAGLTIDAIALADHYSFSSNPLADRAFDWALITEKDAVKCRANAALAADRRIGVVPLVARLDTGLIDFVEARLNAARATATEAMSHGSATA